MIDQSLVGPLFSGEYLQSLVSGQVRYLDPLRGGEYMGSVADVSRQLQQAGTVTPAFRNLTGGQQTDWAPWLIGGGLALGAALLLRRGS